MAKPPRSAFTLLEALLATTLLVIILGLLATIWQNAFRTADRLRSILLAHQRAREAMDQVEDILLQRSGAMPLVAQEVAPGRHWPFKIGGWQSKVHMDLTSMDVNALTMLESTPGIDANGDGDKGDSFPQVWADTPPNGPGPKDAYSPGLQLKDATIGAFGWAWGMGRKFMWHSDIVKFDRDRSFIDMSGAPKPPAISYANIDTGRGYLDDVGNGLSDVNWIPRLGRRYSTTPAGAAFNGTGPYRGVTIVPWTHQDSSGTQRVTPWLGMSHVFRVESGPSFFREPWSNGKWVSKQTGDYGTTSAGTLNGVALDTGRPLEPNWNFVTGTNWNPTAADPAIGTPRPPYGITITDKGGTRWRCEAPHLMLWDSSLRSWGYRTAGMVNSHLVNDANKNFSTDHLFRALQMRNFLTIKEANPDAFGNYSGSAFDATQNYQQIGNIFSTQFSRFTVHTARLSGDWTTAPAGATGVAARGRWGSLTIPGWWNGSGTVHDPARAWSGTGNTADGLTAGFPGAAPSSEETAGHPAWVAVDMGTVGGLGRAQSLGFELVFTYAQALR